MIQKRILIIVGEASGDLHAANLVKEIQKRNNQIHFSGMGGKNMREAGVEIIEDCANVSVVGLTELAKQFPKLYGIFNKFKNIFKKNPPDLAILVDCPGFNLRMAKIAKNANVKVFYYISPQLWAWHQSRVKIVKKYVDLMAVVFPFEVDFYQRLGVKSKFVGHPLLNYVKPTMPKAEAKQFFNISTDNPVVGLLPGSRKVEIKRLLPIMQASAKLLKQRFPTIQFVLPLASTLTLEDLTPYLTDKSLDIKIISGHNNDLMNICDAAIISSGTATLEATLLEVPMTIVYRVSWLTALVGKLVMKVPFLGICNIIAGKSIVKEFLQFAAKPAAIANEIDKILTNKSYHDAMKHNLTVVKQSLHGDNQQDAAQLALEFLNN